MLMINDCRYYLITAGIPMPDADQLRRISMTLHRWHELECGDDDGYKSYSITRGKRHFTNDKWQFEYDDNGKPFLELHYHSSFNSKTDYRSIPDRERGALKRLDKIMARYPAFKAYVQTDPRGCSLYILRASDIPADADISSCYNRGIAVHK